MKKKANKKSLVYAFDFDGVIADYHGFKGRYYTGEPVKEVVKAIKILKKQGHKITIFSTRGNAVLKRYCKKYNIPADYFNENPEVKTGNQGKPVAHVYIDDRAICYKGQSAKLLLKQIKNFKTYWKAD